MILFEEYIHKIVHDLLCYNADEIIRLMKFLGINIYQEYREAN